MSASLVWPIVVPLGGALLCLPMGSRARRFIASVTAGLTLVSSSVVVWAVWTRGPLVHLVGNWGAPLGIDLRADGLSAVMLVTVALVAALIGVEVLRGPAREELNLPLWLMAWSALDALLLSNDTFNAYVTLELATLASVALIGAHPSREAPRAALRYLLFALPGSLVYLFGVAVLYGLYATLDAATLRERFSMNASSHLALAFMSGGLALKAAVFPLHAWLPLTYARARPTVSALLAALLGKGPVYLLIRLWFDVFPEALETAATHLLGVLGAVAVVWGSLLALRQRRLKALIAYSSVGQIGYLFIVFALATSGAFAGAIYLAISHAAAKASLFLAANTVERALGHDALAGLGGLAHRLPVTFFAIALAGISLMGMPPSGGFVAKWLLVVAAIEKGDWWLAIVILVGGLLAAAYMFRILRNAFATTNGDEPARMARYVDELPSFALALLALALGVVANLPLSLLGVGRAP